MRRLPGETARKAIGNDWDLVVIDATRIRFLQIIYMNHEGQTARAVTKVRAPTSRRSINGFGRRRKEGQTGAQPPAGLTFGVADPAGTGH
jgi:hypothetical protein